MCPFTEPEIPKPAPAPKSHAWDQKWFLRSAQTADRSRYGRRTTIEETAFAHGGPFTGARIEVREISTGPSRSEYLLLLSEPWTFPGPAFKLVALALIVTRETTWAYTSHDEAREAWKAGTALDIDRELGLDE